MIVNFKRANVWIIQHGKMIDAPKDAEGKQIQKQIFQGQAVKIIPGLNTVEDPIWNDIKEYPDVKAALSSGDLEIVEDSKPAGSKSKGNDNGIVSLAGMDVKKAISVVEGQMEKDALAAWKKGEKRPQVLKAIKDQLAKIEQAEAAFNDNKE